MNESIKNMIERRSVRGYKPDMIPKEDLDLILEAGTYAATGMGMQSPVIVAVTDKATRDQLSKMNADVMGTDTDPFYGAPVVLVVLADKNRPTYIYDGSLVMGNSEELTGTWTSCGDLKVLATNRQERVYSSMRRWQRWKTLI